ncbi:MAG: glycoside hydrolase family 9 protein [Bacteroidaceae bacterium]|nr:glycoside hydrolase family 9 protein [Bacteroidaceae bacterium]
MKKLLLTTSLLLTALWASAQSFHLTNRGYFQSGGVDVMAFDDIYPEGHQGGVSVIMHGNRVATNGDLRLEETPGQWQAVPKQLKRTAKDNTISTTLCYPDSSRHMTGFNPMVYPDLHFSYNVSVKAIGNAVEVTVDLDKPLPKEYVGKVGFNMEFFPGSLFGKPWIMDNQQGIFPQQPNSPVVTKQESIIDNDWKYRNKGKMEASIPRLKGEGYSPINADLITAEPYAVGRIFTSRPDDDLNRLTIESKTADMALIDGRMNHNNGWFVLRSLVPEGATKGAIRWIIRPNVVKDWHYAPVVQTSQVGYHTNQDKVAVIETLTPSNSPTGGGQSHPGNKLSDGLYPPPVEGSGEVLARLLRFTADGEQLVREIAPKQWGDFLRYKYYHIDFSDIKESGLYQVEYAGSRSSVFKISDDAYDRGVWQPVLEYFLPVQMCHMRVAEKYRVWHDACHLDDALMATPGNHIDGYAQDAKNLPFAPDTQVPNQNFGGWHDAGDFDLRVESQAGEMYNLTLIKEAFNPQLDVTSIDHHKHVTEIHQPDGKDDLLQQIENGALTVVNGYLALGRLYRGIICEDLRQYVLLGDASSMTNNKKGDHDDRRVYTEDNPGRELSTAANLAAAYRVLQGYNDTLAVHCLNIAKEIFEQHYAMIPSSSPTRGGQNHADGVNASPVWRSGGVLLHPAAELYLSTKDKKYLDLILDNQDAVIRGIDRTGWYMTRIEQLCAVSKDKKMKRFSKAFREALPAYKERLQQQMAETPYGVPYRPHIWGAGWDIQSFGAKYYYFAKAYPELFDSKPVCNALNFILGCHPGSNTASFAGGVGAKSATVGYGLNRADWSYIPGGVISGTALIRPDYPELLTFPFLWQQTEYVLGGGSSNYLFLVLAAKQLLTE